MYKQILKSISLILFVVFFILLFQNSAYSFSSKSDLKSKTPESMHELANSIYQKHPFSKNKPNALLTKFWRPIIDKLKKLSFPNVSIPSFKIGKYEFSLGDLTVAVIISLMTYLLVRIIISIIMIKFNRKSADIELLEQKTVKDFLDLYTEHRESLNFNEALRFIFLAFIKSIMTHEYKHTSNYQLYLYSSKLFPYNKKELRDFIKLFEDTRYGTYLCDSSDLDLAHELFIKLSDQYSLNNSDMASARVGI